MENRELRPGELLKRINDQMEKNANNTLQSLDITFGQLKLLIALSKDFDDSATLKEIERYFGVSQATVAGIVTRMEKKGLIIGYTDRNDKRVKHVRISDSGREICQRMKSSMEEHESEMLAPLDASEQEQLRYLLQKLYDGMLSAQGLFK